MKKVIWLTSYPKSGNTWFRIILNNLINKTDADINNLQPTYFSSSRSYLNKFYGIDTKLLSNDEINFLKPEYNDYLAKTTKEILFRKNHDAYIYLPDNRPILGNPEYYKAIYIIRNPLSVAPSLANHFNWSIDRAIEVMCTDNYCLPSSENYKHLTSQNFFSWSQNVNSWTNEKNNFELFVIKYEDLHIKSFDILKDAFIFSGLKFLDSDLESAIENSSFDRVSSIEKEFGFKDKLSDTKSFFRKGKIDSWKDELNDKQINKIISKHKKVMIKFNYL
ncbi:MAG: sulfotransferase domain-containing protein [Candidatus Sericytochromatia bacterium]